MQLLSDEKVILDEWALYLSPTKQTLIVENQSISLSPSQSFTETLIALKQIEGHTFITLLAQAKILAKLNGTDYEDEKKELMEASAKYSAQLMTALWKQYGGIGEIPKPEE